VTFSQRNRIISIRVSDQEYEEVKRISRERGAHSVSDYVRWVLTTWGLSAQNCEPINSAILAQVAALQRQVDWLSTRVAQKSVQGD